MSTLIEELTRRKVIRVAAIYAVAAWLLIQVADVVLPSFNAPQWVMQALIISLFLGFPVAVVLAWIFKITPDGIEEDEIKESAVDRSVQFLAVSVVAIASIIGMVFYLNLGLDDIGSVDREVVDLVAAPPEKSIAVLPFVAMSSGEDDEHFADGLTEELLNNLAQLSDLKVSARTSSFYYKGQNYDIREVGTNLGVRHVLEGSVRRSGNQLRVTAQLIDVENGFHLWSANFDRTMEDIFVIQDDIAAQVTGALSVEILGEEFNQLASHGTSNPEAQNLYLIAQARLQEMLSGAVLPTRNIEFAASVRNLFEEITEIDPSFAQGWAGLAETYLRLSRSGIPDASGTILAREEGTRLAESAVNRAVALAPDALAVRLAKVNLDKRMAQDFDDILRSYENIVEDFPHSTEALRELATLYESSNPQLALERYDQLLEIDPLSPLMFNRARFIGDLDAEQGIELLKRVGDLYPDIDWRRWIGRIERRRGNLHHAILWHGEDASHAQHEADWYALGDRDRALALKATNPIGGQLGDLANIDVAMLGGQYEFVLQELDNGAIPDINFERMNRVYALFYLRRFEELNEFINQTWPDAESIVASAFGRNSMILAIAYTAQLAGNQGLVEELFEFPREFISSGDEDLYGINKLQWDELQMYMLLVEGRDEEALDFFDSIVASGWRWLGGFGSATGHGYTSTKFVFEDNPILDSVRDNPRFIETLNFVKADNARMLAELEAGLTLEDIINAP